ncbi:phosphoenolpyruvate carboxylase [Leuconostocaceae bacterium ESL0958]|nr:phosphoenolpyruvate carboxylase [Leuconostocaceae bacterium ESL0958]
MKRRTIPAIMGTQHPDNANAPFWAPNQNPFISAYSETTEAYENYRALNVDEYMWDWEGKHADAAVIDRLFSAHYDYFKQEQLGRDKFLTFRFPNIWEEKGYNLMQAMTAMLSSEDFANDLGFEGRPLFEAILPMAERADQILTMQELFEKLATFKDQAFTPGEKNAAYIEMIPLFEEFKTQYGAPEILKEYLRLHQEHFGFRPDYLRVFLAGSDSALSAGLLSSLIGNKLALARLHRFADSENIAIYPISGTGSAIFRGGLAPHRIQRYLREFPGVRTATVQSAFRYDFPLKESRTAIQTLKEQLPTVPALTIDVADETLLKTIADRAAHYYQESLTGIVADMQPIFAAFPKRRDRRQHVGVLGYSRGDSEMELPRAINFTGAFYSVGLPPEFIGFGRALASLDEAERAVLDRYYPSLQDDFAELLTYVSPTALAALTEANPAWAAVAEDVQFMADYLNQPAGPQSSEQVEHAELARQVVAYRAGAPAAITALINQMAPLRHFLG